MKTTERFFIKEPEFKKGHDWKIYRRIKKRISEEEIEPLKAKISNLERELKDLKMKYQKMINPSIKVLKKIKI